jgi:poly(glycerol-phosphate) alpha-glucosyltransferase
MAREPDWWLDRLTEGETAFIISDSKPTARFLKTYRRPGRVTVHVVHGSHLAGHIGPWGRLRPSRADVFRHLDGFDAVVFLTERQRRDARLLFGRTRNLCVVPNSRDPSPAPADSEARPPTAGIMLAPLAGIKRVGHAVEAIARARSGASALRLDVYGDGAERARIEDLVRRLGLTDVVRLHGHRPDAREHLASASFLLMTSSSEGFSLAILEAMGAGCIPIAYDIRYGPAELISNGRTGFLVRNGSIRGLARAILRLQRMPAERVATMRRAARREAERYTYAAVMPLWARELAAARERNARTTS